MNPLGGTPSVTAFGAGAALAFLCAVLLAGCTAQSRLRCADQGACFRDLSVPIASSTRSDPARIDGAWVVAARFPATLAPDRVVVETGGAGMVAVRTETGGEAVTWVGRLDGPGRIMVRDESGTARVPIWLLWTDDDYRTAAIGTPDGRFGWIMERAGRGGADRRAAARQVLEFNGYDLTRLRNVE